MRGDTAAHAAQAATGVRLDKPEPGSVPAAAAAAASAAAPRVEAEPVANRIPPPAPSPVPQPKPAAAPTPMPTPAAPPRATPHAAAAPRSKPSPGVRASSGQPGQRKPVRLRWWLLGLGLLWVVWLVANPGKRRIEAQMDKAIGLATSCKPREAQTELIALRKTRATPEQLQHVQQVLNDAAADCTRKRQRDKAWRDARAAVESALAASSFDKARQRLRAFTKRWGDDDNARALRDKIEARSPEHPRADGGR